MIITSSLNRKPEGSKCELIRGGQTIITAQNNSNAENAFIIDRTKESKKDETKNFPAINMQTYNSVPQFFAEANAWLYDKSTP